MIQCLSLQVAFVINASDLAAYDLIVVQLEWQITNVIVKNILLNKRYMIAFITVFEGKTKRYAIFKYYCDYVFLISVSFRMSVIIL